MPWPRARSSVDRAPDFGSGGRGFESLRARQSPISARRVYAGRETHLAGEVVKIEPGRSATLALCGGPHVESLVTYSVEPLGEGRSRVIYSANGHLRGPLALLQPILPAVGRAEARKNLARLERRIAAGIPPSSAEPTPDL
jgi:carbon monoxide dehydrogenase subunit G